MADEDHFWPAWDSDDEASPVEGAGADQGLDAPTDIFATVGAAGAASAAAGSLDDGTYGVTDKPGPPKGRKLRSGLGKAMMTAGAVIGVLVLAYLIDVVTNWNDVPRGVSVAGVDVGGLSRTDAEQRLREQLGARFDEPVRIVAGDVETQIVPAQAGLGIDWQRTLEQAGRQPLSPITRVTSLWTSREVGIVSKSDDDKLTATVRELAKSEINHKKREGNIKFKDVSGQAGAVKAVPVLPRHGQQLPDIDAAVEQIDHAWLNPGGVRLAVDVQQVKATKDGVEATLKKLVEPAVSAPIEVDGEGADAVLTPKAIGDAFKFTPADDGSLKAKVDQESLKGALQPQLASTEHEGRDAEIVFSGGRPTVEPSEDGRQIQWAKTLQPYLEVIEKTEDRQLKVVYSTKKPEVTTEEAKALGIKEVIGEFTTGGFAPDSGQNIKRVAEEVDGAIVKPGTTFSLNGHTGPRTSAQGYIDAGIIEDGVPGRAVGGGISQFATTLYNAGYFAGMRDAGHKEHSYYISRYPIAREATVFQSASGASLIDIAFTNDAGTGAAIQTIWTPSSITVKIWGTKRYEVDSITGPKRNIKKAGERTVDDENCEPSGGIDGFTASDTRVLTDIKTGDVRRETRTVTYNPKPAIKCKKRDADRAN